MEYHIGGYLDTRRNINKLEHLRHDVPPELIIIHSNASYPEARDTTSLYRAGSVQVSMANMATKMAAKYADVGALFVTYGFGLEHLLRCHKYK